MKHRHFPFFPDHWKGDAALRLCSAAARGLWIDLMCEMHGAQTYGHLETSTGVPIVTPEQIARIVGESVGDVRKWLGELEHSEVFSRTETGTIYSRRMVRDAEGREEWRERKGRSRGRESRESHADVTPMSRKSHAENHADVTDQSRESPIAKGKGKGNNTDTVPVSAPSGSDESNGKDDDADPLAWVNDLRAATNAIAGLTIRELTVDQRVTLGRYFSWRFANCTKSESNNRKHGANAAKAFAQMADAPIFRDFTVREYVDHAAVYRRDVMQDAPFHDPFSVRTILDPKPIEPAGARR